MTAPTQNNHRTSLGLTVLQLLRFVLFNLSTPAALFLAAGTLAWPQAWVYVLASFGFTFFGLWLVRRSHPDLLRERAEAIGKQDIPDWDKRLMPVLAIVLPLLTAVIAGLDTRFGWSPPLPLWLNLAGLALLLFSYALSSWAVVANKYYSSFVRVQHERSHQVVDQGPYRIVRHPGYLSNLTALLGLPILLGALWAYVPSALAALAFIARTALEDRYLQENLPGYAAFSQRTRYRLLPGVW